MEVKNKKKKKGTKNEQCYTSRIGCHFIATVLPDPNYIISIYPNFWARKKKALCCMNRGALEAAAV